MKKKLIIFATIIAMIVILFLHQTRWGVSVSAVEVWFKDFSEGEIRNEIDDYRQLGEDYFGSDQGWETPEIFPSENDQDYYKAIIFFSIRNFSILPCTLKSAYLVNSTDNRGRVYHAFDLLEDNVSINGFKSVDHEYILHLDLYKNGRTDEEIIRDLSDLKIELHYSNKVFQLTKTIDLSKVKFTLLEKNPFDPN